MAYTTIGIDPATRDQLRRFKLANDAKSYDAAIQILLDCEEEQIVSKESQNK